MNDRKIIGLVTASPEVGTAVGLSIKALGAADYLGHMSDLVMDSLAPKVNGKLITESHVRRIANKLGRSIPVQKFAGREVKDQKEANAFFLEIADQFGGDTWAANYFLDTDFFRKPDGFYALAVAPMDSEDIKRRMREGQYFEIVLLPEGGIKPTGVQYSLSVGESTGAELNTKVKKLLTKIKNDIKESERR